MKKLAFMAAFLFAASANAGVFHLTGQITYHNDVVFTYFTLNNDATDVRLWTDSFQSGTNFDPITALWASDGSLLSQNDDNDQVNSATQSWYDSGLELSSLSAGDYIYTIAAYDNFANDNNLSDGFFYDNDVPILLSDWDQPANGHGMGPNWSLWLDGVDDAAVVPEPATFALLGLGLAGIAIIRRKKSK